MRKYCCILLAFLFAVLHVGATHVMASNTSPENLRAALVADADEKTRVDALLNLVDLSIETLEDEPHYFFQLYDLAYKSGDKFAFVASLRPIVIYYLDRPQEAESLQHYLYKAEQFLKGSEYDGLVAYYKMMNRARELQDAAPEKKSKVCERLVAFYDNRQKQETEYERAERLFMCGVCAYQLRASTTSRAVIAGLPYWEEGWRVISNFNPVVRRLFAGNIMSGLMLAYNFSGNAEKFVKMSDEYLAMLDIVFSNPEVISRRPYMIKDQSYWLSYQGLINSDDLIGRGRAHEYYMRYRKFVNSASVKEELLYDKTAYYSISQKHYANRGEYAKALAYCDSLIRAQELGQGVYSGAYVGYYRDRAGLLRQCGRLSEACDTYEQVIKLSDSLSLNEYAGKVSEMEAKLGVDKLHSVMVANRRKIVLIFLSFTLLIVVFVGIYLIRSLRRERHLKNELFIQCERVQECDRMKTQFINMMGHEVRTPLNVIGGFAQVLLSGTLSASQRDEYLAIIHEHTQIITLLFNDMMEVASLDNCATDLSREAVYVNKLICDTVSKTDSSYKGKLIDIRMELLDEEILLQSHSGYVSHVLRELIRNACKFADSGTILVQCSKSDTTNELLLSVSDIGPGIPADKVDSIFDRFMQINPFTQGTGLGLHLCQLIVEKLGGRIYLDRSYDKGARFVVALPFVVSKIH